MGDGQVVAVVPSLSTLGRSYTVVLSELKSHEESLEKPRSHTMPIYYNPVMRHSLRQFHRKHNQNVDQCIKAIATNQRIARGKLSEEALQLVRQIPIDLLVHDWLNTDPITVDMRLYMVDKLMPTLVMGVEKLLQDVSKTSLEVDNIRSANLNPVNELARYLMRNNPNFSNFSLMSPYSRGLQEVTAVIKKHVVTSNSHKLVRLKTELSLRREERRLQNHLKDQYMENKKENIHKAFIEWSGVTGDIIPEHAMESMLLSFSETAERLPVELRELAHYAGTTTSDYNTGGLSEDLFVNHILRLTERFPRDIFETFCHELCSRSIDYKELGLREQFIALLQELFRNCDASNLKVLERQQVLNLLNDFWDSSSKHKRLLLQNPRKWPVLEFHEIDSSHFDIDDEGVSSVNEEIVLDVDVGDGTGSVEPSELEELLPNETKNISEESVVKEEGEPVNHVISEDQNINEETVVKGEDEQDNDVAVEETEKTGDEKPSNFDQKSNGGPTPDDVKDIKSNGIQDNVIVDVENETILYNVSSIETENVADNPPVTATDTVPGDTPQHAPSNAPSIGQGEVSDDILFEAMADLGVTDPGTNDTRRTSDMAILDIFEQKSRMPFSPTKLHPSQFIELIRVFLGNSCDDSLSDRLLHHLKIKYKEQDDFLVSVMEENMKTKQECNYHNTLDNVFNMLDNDGSGTVGINNLKEILQGYGEGMHIDSIENADETIKHVQDGRLLRSEFRAYIDAVVSEMLGDNHLIQLADHMLMSNSLTYAERIRGMARKKWIKEILNAGEISRESMEPVFKNVFEALFKDAEAHGKGKRLSCNINLLENNMEKDTYRGGSYLRCIAATPEDASFMVGQCLYRDMKNISFAVVESGRPIHVPTISGHGSVYMWGDSEVGKKDGSVVIVPLKDFKKRVFGTLSVDNIRNSGDNTVFISHDIEFYLGVAKSFSEAFFIVDLRKKMLNCIGPFLMWLRRLCPSVLNIDVYVVQQESDDYSLGKVNLSEAADTLQSSRSLYRNDNIFKQYLFNCIDSSRCVVEAFDHGCHLVFPLRNDDGKGFIVLDLTTHSNRLSLWENEQLQRLLKVLDTCYNEVSNQYQGESYATQLAIEKEFLAHETELLFHREFLCLIWTTMITSLDYSSLSKYDTEPQEVFMVLTAVIMIIKGKKAWEIDKDMCLKELDSGISDSIVNLDPTTDTFIDAGAVVDILEDIDVSKLVDLPKEATFLYSWALCCLDLHKLAVGLRGVRPERRTSIGYPNFSMV